MPHYSSMKYSPPSESLNEAVRLRGQYEVTVAIERTGVVAYRPLADRRSRKSINREGVLASTIRGISSARTAGTRKFTREELAYESPAE